MPSQPKRDCTYCPKFGADVCVRVWAANSGPDTHVYAHRACADARGITPMYVLLEQPTAGEAS